MLSLLLRYKIASRDLPEPGECDGRDAARQGPGPALRAGGGSN